MYLTSGRSYYDADGTQHARRGLFLILMQPDSESLEKLGHPLLSPGKRKGFPVRAIVRKVVLTQFGQWMMGRARIHGHSITLSGSYGQDGLIKDVPMDVYRWGTVLPAALWYSWAHGGGWNSAGSEAPLLRQWALDNLQRLRR